MNIEKGYDKGFELHELEDKIDMDFIQRVINEVTTSCALPLAVPVERIPEYIRQAAMWFWQNDDFATHQRMYLIPFKNFIKDEGVSKIIKLPQQIISVIGCFRTNSCRKFGIMGDFSVERMLMNNYSWNYGGMSSGHGTGYGLTDVVTSLYEIDQYNTTLTPTLSYNYNTYGSILTILGDLQRSDILINCFVRTRIQELYNNYYFFRWVVCLVKRSLATIYGTFEFKLPGGVTINYSNFSDQANDELEEIKEWVKGNHSASYFFQPNTL